MNRRLPIPQAQFSGVRAGSHEVSDAFVEEKLRLSRAVAWKSCASWSSCPPAGADRSMLPGVFPGRPAAPRPRWDHAGGTTAGQVDFRCRVRPRIPSAPRLDNKADVAQPVSLSSPWNPGRFGKPPKRPRPASGFAPALWPARTAGRRAKIHRLAGCWRPALWSLPIAQALRRLQHADIVRRSEGGCRLASRACAGVTPTRQPRVPDHVYQVRSGFADPGC